MGRKGSLSASEKSIITSQLAEGKSTLEILKNIGRYHQTVKNFVKDPTKVRKRVDKGESRVVSRRSLSQIKREVMKNPGQTSKELFNRIGEPNVSRTTRCRILGRVAKPLMPIIKPPLSKTNKENRLKWAANYMKVDFSKVLFTDETRASLDGPDGWSKGWVSLGRDRHRRLRRQQGGGGIMIWAGIIGGVLVGPWRVPEGVKMTAATYIAFLQQNFEPWFKKQKVTFKRMMILMQDNAPSHAAKKTTAYLQQLGFCGPRKMNWPACSPDLNPIENFWSMLKRKVYENGRQFMSKDVLWSAIVDVCRSFTYEEIQKLTGSMDNRLLQVISKKGSSLPNY